MSTATQRLTRIHLGLLAGMFVNAGTAVAQTVVNGSLEAWGTAVCSVNSPPNGWSDYTSAGIGVDEGDFANCPHTIPTAAQQGDRYARTYSTTAGGEGISQDVSGFTPGQLYAITYFYSGSNLYGGSADGQWEIYVDDVLADSGPVVSSLTDFWTQHGYVFLATAATHNIGFRGRAVSGSSTASIGIDSISIDPAVLAGTQGFGNGCPAGNPLVLTSNLPQLGMDWDLTGSGIEAASSFAIFWFGDTALNPGASLAGIGAAGCFAYTNGNLNALFTSVTAGTATYTVTIPNSFGLAGLTLTAQMMAASSSTTIGLTTSNGLTGTVGS